MFKRILISLLILSVFEAMAYIAFNMISTAEFSPWYTNFVYISLAAVTFMYIVFGNNDN